MKIQDKCMVGEARVIKENPEARIYDYREYEFASVNYCCTPEAPKQPEDCEMTEFVGDINRDLRAAIFLCHATGHEIGGTYFSFDGETIAYRLVKPQAHKDVIMCHIEDPTPQSFMFAVRGYGRGRIDEMRAGVAEEFERMAWGGCPHCGNALLIVEKRPYREGTKYRHTCAECDSRGPWGTSERDARREFAVPVHYSMREEGHEGY